MMKLPERWAKKTVFTLLLLPEVVLVLIAMGFLLIDMLV
jgi:hypothetical protein